MQAKTLTGLFVATLVTVGVAALTSWSSPGSGATDQRGDSVFPGLAEKANQLTALELDAGDWHAELSRDGDGFVDGSGFPVSAQPIRAIVAGLSTLVFEEAKTADATRYPDLELADPSPEVGAGRLIELTNGDQKLASLIVGERDLTVGGMRGGVFARLPGEAQSWLLRGSVPLPGSRGELFDTQLIDWNTNDIAGLLLRDANGSLALTSAAPGEPLNAEDATALDAKKVLELGALVNDLRFADVRKADAATETDGTLEYTTRSGLSLLLTRLRGGEDYSSQRWLRIRIAETDSADEAAREQAIELAARLNGFEFQLNETVWDKLAQSPASLVATETKPQEKE